MQLIGTITAHTDQYHNVKDEIPVMYMIELTLMPSNFSLSPCIDQCLVQNKMAGVVVQSY